MKEYRWIKNHKRYVITTAGNVYLNDFDDYEEAYVYFERLDIPCNLYDDKTGGIIWK